MKGPPPRKLVSANYTLQLPIPNTTPMKSLIETLKYKLSWVPPHLINSFKIWLSLSLISTLITIGIYNVELFVMLIAGVPIVVPPAMLAITIIRILKR